MDVNVADLALNCPADVRVCACVHVWGKSCLNTDLCCAKCSRLLCTSYYFIYWQKVSFLFTKIPAKCAKAALLYADIGKIDVSINYVCYDVSNSSFSELVCNHSYQVKVKPFCMEQSCCLVN